MSAHRSAPGGADAFSPVMGTARGRASGGSAGTANRDDEEAGPSLLDRLDKLCEDLCALAEAGPNRLTEHELLQHSAGVLAREVALRVWEPCLFAGLALLPVGEADANIVLALIELDRDAAGVGRANAYICRGLVVAVREPVRER